MNDCATSYSALLSTTAATLGSAFRSSRTCWRSAPGRERTSAAVAGRDTQDHAALLEGNVPATGVDQRVHRRSGQQADEHGGIATRPIDERDRQHQLRLARRGGAVGGWGGGRGGGGGGG